MEKIRDKHVPLRMCVACRCMKPHNELLRFVCNAGTAEVDTEKKKFGRGAYICRNAGCLAKAAKRNVLARHLRCSVPKELYAAAGEMIPVEP